jgi:hypothetical protein
VIATSLFAVTAVLIIWWVVVMNRFQMAWIMGGLFLAIAVVYFLAAWRKGFRWLFSRRALGFDAAVAATVLTLAVLFYTEESWRGKRAWAALQRETAARGESLEFVSLKPPPVPDEQNFAKAPGVAELLGLPHQTNFGWPFDLGREYLRPRASWALQQHTDLSRWQKLFRSHAKKAGSAKRTAAPLISFPATPEPQTPAADVLLALSKYETNLAVLRAAENRSVMSLPLDYSKGWFVFEDLLPPEQSLFTAALLLYLRASAELVEGRTEGACQDVLLALHFAHLVREQPIHQGYGKWMTEFGLQPIWEGLAAHRWHDQELAALQKKLTEVDLLRGYRPYLHSETLWMMELIDDALTFIQRRPSQLDQRVSSDEAARIISWVVRAFYPVGWLYQDKVWLYRFYESHADALDGVALQYDTMAKTKADRQIRSITDPVMDILMVPKFRFLIEDESLAAVTLQIFLDEAVTACALERFRLAHGQYPATLDALVPEYLRQVPADILAVPPAKLKYVTTANGGFKVYSVGVNHVDNGGQINRGIDRQGDILSQLCEGDSDLVWVQPGER